MEILLYKNQFPKGTKYSIQFLWDSDKFVIRTYEREYVVSDNEIVIKDGKFYFNPSKQNPKYNSNDIEIPENVIERKNKLNMDLQNRKGSIAHVDHIEGKIYFSLNSEGKIIAKQGCKTAISYLETIENKNAINVESLGLSVPYIEVPQKVEIAYLKAKHIRIMESVRLISAGKSLLFGKEYHKLNQSIPLEEWERVESLFENLGKGGSGLKGWLTSTPEDVENILGIKHAVSDRKKEIEKHEKEARTFENAIISIQK